MSTAQPTFGRPQSPPDMLWSIAYPPEFRAAVESEPYPLEQMDFDDGRDTRIMGYVLAIGSPLMPPLCLGGLVLGINTATTWRRRGHGAAIICLSVLLGLVGFALWTYIWLSYRSGYGY